MRCKACNTTFKVTDKHVVGLKDSIMEELCPRCLMIIRASLYDGGPSNELENILCELEIVLDDDDEET